MEIDISGAEDTTWIQLGKTLQKHRVYSESTERRFGI